MREEEVIVMLMTSRFLTPIYENLHAAEIVPASLSYESKIYKLRMLRFSLGVLAEMLSWFLAGMFSWIARNNSFHYLAACFFRKWGFY
jgi:hypothetical protein